MNRATPLSPVSTDIARAPHAIAEKWPRRDALLFAMAASAGLWTGIYFLICQAL